MKRLFHTFIVVLTLFIISCSSANFVSSNGDDISKYKYIVFGKENDGDAELEDIIMQVQNELASKFTVISPNSANKILDQGAHILSPRINVKSEKWDGGHTYITIVFHDYHTNQSIAVLKSSGIGMSVSQDQKRAFSAIKREIDKLFSN
ncbi:MAG: hypothetical protein J6T70_16980 [Bacteroidales bacterium]|nr:hypothetical protein [Bacteroidales bacterium]MBO7598734.1 hypothetical protein [Bacteroidales bacterium]